MPYISESLYAFESDAEDKYHKRQQRLLKCVPKDVKQWFNTEMTLWAKYGKFRAYSRDGNFIELDPRSVGTDLMEGDKS